MPRANQISGYLDEVHADWQRTCEEFSRNVYLKHYWPIPFFGNPRHAFVATIGVNPSSGEFASERCWSEVQRRVQWKQRLRDYFNHNVKPHEWFEPWRRGLSLLDFSYEKGSATHLDLSYRPTRAMARNRKTDAAEFRRMIEKDVAWLFKLILHCQRLKVLFTFGHVFADNRDFEPMHCFLRAAATRHGFQTISEPPGWCLRHQLSGREFYVHHADTGKDDSIEKRVVENLHSHLNTICHKLAGRNYSSPSVSGKPASRDLPGD